MLDIFGLLNTRIWRAFDRNIDNVLFKLHYRATVLLLVAFSLIVTSRQYIGDPINCMVTAGNVPDRVIDQYCWISTTFTLPLSLNKKVGKEVPFPGVDKSTENEERVYHQYYQWVCFVLFLQAVMFYIPHFMWKQWESGRLKTLADGVEMYLLTDDTKSSKKEQLVSYLHQNLGQHNLYFFYFVACEALNFMNVIGQIFFTNRFLGGAFANYGVEVIKYSEMNQDDRVDPMVKVFPRVTKCTFHTFGSSGDIQKHDALCVLPINIINEKLYVFLWFWFVILSVISGVGLIYRGLIILLPKLRLHVFRMRTRFLNSGYLNVVNENAKVGDIFLLSQLSKNVNCRLFCEVVEELARRLERKESDETIKLSAYNTDLKGT